MPLVAVFCERVQCLLQQMVEPFSFSGTTIPFGVHLDLVFDSIGRFIKGTGPFV